MPNIYLIEHHYKKKKEKHKKHKKHKRQTRDLLPGIRMYARICMLHSFPTYYGHDDLALTRCYGPMVK